MTIYPDKLDRQEILERWYPYAHDICLFCGSPEDEQHLPTCSWVRIRRQYRRKRAA